MDVFDTRYFRVNKLLLLFTGQWPTQSLYNKNTIFCCVLICTQIVILPQVIYLIKYSKNLNDLYNVLPTLAGAFICFVKGIAFHWNSKKFKMLVQHVRHDWNLLSQHDDIWILIEYIEKSRIFTLVYIIFISTGAFFYLTAPLTVPILDILMGSDVTRPKRLPHVGVFFLDLEKHYYSILGITYIGYIACCMLVIAVDTIYFALLQHICGVLAILSRRLKKLHDTEDIDHSNAISKRDRDIKNMVQCIQLQIRIERLIQLTESMFAICLFTDIGLGILFQCSASVMIVTHTDTLYLVKNFPLLLIQTARFFFNCWIGQRIIDHSSQVSFAAYNGKWYQMSLEAKKILLFLMMKCRKPYRITMTKLYVICMESYSTLMKTSASYVTLMVSLNSNDM